MKLTVPVWVPWLLAVVFVVLIVLGVGPGSGSGYFVGAGVAGLLTFISSKLAVTTAATPEARTAAQQTAQGTTRLLRAVILLLALLFVGFMVLVLVMGA